LALFVSAIYLALSASTSGHQSLYIATSSFLLGFFWQQLAFMGHDLGHNSVRGSAKSDWAPGLLVTVLFGVSVQWWKRSHNVHHVVTNSLQHDCDIQYLPVFALSERQLRPEGFFSSYHERLFKFDWLASWIVRWQHVLYWPVMGIARFNLYVQSLALVWDSSKHVPHRTAEKLALAAFWTWHLLLLYSLPCNWTRLAYYVLSHHFAGLTHVQITLSHFAMPVHEDHYSASSAPESREHFLRSQFATTMDVDCSEWMDWLHGGLQFQLTHHLLPRIPRHHLREVRERFVKPFAKRNGLDYQAQSFWEANKTVYHRMRTAAEASRNIKTQSPFADSILGQFLRTDG
jgi:delta8-fatty-acid desaturase